MHINVQSEVIVFYFTWPGDTNFICLLIMCFNTFTFRKTSRTVDEGQYFTSWGNYLTWIIQRFTMCFEKKNQKLHKGKDDLDNKLCNVRLTKRIYCELVGAFYYLQNKNLKIWFNLRLWWECTVVDLVTHRNRFHLTAEGGGFDAWEWHQTLLLMVS